MINICYCPMAISDSVDYWFGWLNNFSTVAALACVSGVSLKLWNIDISHNAVCSQLLLSEWKMK